MTIKNIKYIGTMLTPAMDKPDNNESTIDIINSLLKKGMFIDPVYHDSFFEVSVSIDSVDELKGLLFRMLYEQVYLKSCLYSTYDVKTNECIIYLSLSEAIDYLYKATPPVLQNTVEDAISSIDSILECLEIFLTDNTGNMLVTYLSYFIKTIHAYPFESTATYDVTRAHKLMNFQHDKNQLIFDIELSNNSFKSVDDILHNEFIFGTMYCSHEVLETHINSIMILLKHFGISNIYSDEKGLYISVYSYYFNFFTMVDFQYTDFIDTFKNIIQKTYNGILW